LFSGIALGVLVLLVAGQNARAVRRTAEANVQAREARLRELQAELAHASRQSDIGQLASALAHELNQPVGAIGNFLRASRRLLAKAEPEPAADVRHYVNQAIDQADRAAAIIEGMRALADTGHAARAAGDINVAVEEALAIALLDRRGEGVAVVARPADGLPPVLMNRIQVQQVVLNLVRNAIEAMAASPRRELLVESRLIDGAGVEVAVGDSGPGLAPEVEARLFKPFVSTKDTGMGIGLSISRSLVESQDGRMSAERNAAGGTTFRFTLPLAPAGGPPDRS
jgi:two-component system sensor kinase FixL